MITSEAQVPLDVLIVDDSAEEAESIRRQLKSGMPGAYSIRESRSASDALEECRSNPPDCLLLDVRMPEMSGLAFLERLSAGAGFHFPIIVLTGYGDDGVSTQALRRGAQDYLRKDQTTPELLMRAIAHARERFRISQELADANASLNQANLDLRNNTERLHAIFAQSSVGIAQTDLDGRILLANDAFCALTGRNRAELQSMRLPDLAGHLEQDPHHARPEDEKRYRRPDGSFIWVHESVSPIMAPDGKAASQVILARDITARRNGQTAQALLASIVETSADAMIYLDRDGVIRACNRGTESTYGYRAEDLLGKSLEILMPADKLAEYGTLRAEAAANRPAQGLETVRIRQDGYRLNVAVSFSVVRNSGGKVVGFSSVDRDISERKRALEKVRESEARYRLLANAMPQIVFTNNAAGECDFISGQCQEYTGRPLTDLLGVGWLDCLHPDDRERTGADWRTAVKCSSAFQTEYRLRGADGEYRWHLARAKPVKNADGEVTGWIGTSTDIQDSRRTEESLRINEERLRLAQSAARLVMWDLDLRQGRYAELPDFFEQFEFAPGTPVGYQDWLNRVHPEDRDRIGLATRNPSQYASGIEIEFRIMRKDGSVRWIFGKGSTIVDAAGSPVRVTGINLDITESKLVESELMDSRERLRFALNAAGMGIWELNIPTGCISFLGPAAAIFGHSGIREFRMEAFLQEVHAADRKRVETLFRTPTSQDTPYAVEFRSVFPDGSIHWIELQGAVTPGASGEPSRMIGTARDITGRKALEQRVAASEKVESIGVMAAGLAHDFNNLLVGVIGSASLALDILPPGHEVSRLLMDVIQAGERASSLTAQMLAYAGKGQAPPTMVEVSRVAREAAEDIEPKLAAGIEFRHYVLPDLHVRGNKDQICQLIVNLLSNAAESFGPAGGRISLHVREQEVDDQFIKEVLKHADIGPGAYVRIEIRDTGSGIDESIRDKIFEPFFTTRFLGRGLGLAAVAGIVRAHKGAVQVTTSVGRGTTIAILLPLVTMPKPAQVGPVHRSAGSGSSTVLVVDDENLVASLASQILRKQGYQVVVANRGAAALDLIEERAGEISLVLLDLTMPGMGGAEVLRHIRQRYGDMPVILSSGYSEDEAFLQVGDQEVTAFLRKPYGVKELLNKVAGALSRSFENDFAETKDLTL